MTERFELQVAWMTSGADSSARFGNPMVGGPHESAASSMTRPTTSRIRKLARVRLRPARVHPDDVGTVRELVDAARGGDRLAFAALFDRFHPAVYRMLRVRVEAREDVEELVAETFLEGWRTLERHRWTGVPFAAWLLAIATAKADAHQPAEAPVVRESSSSAHLDRILASDEHAEDERRLEATRMLATLSEQHRQVLTLRFYGGLSAEDIGTMLGARTSTVQRMQMAALEQLAREGRALEVAA